MAQCQPRWQLSPETKRQADGVGVFQEASRIGMTTPAPGPGQESLKRAVYSCRGVSVSAPTGFLTQEASGFSKGLDPFNSNLLV